MQEWVFPSIFVNRPINMDGEQGHLIANFKVPFVLHFVEGAQEPFVHHSNVLPHAIDQYFVFFRNRDQDFRGTFFMLFHEEFGLVLQPLVAYFELRTPVLQIFLLLFREFKHLGNGLVVLPSDPQNTFQLGKGTISIKQEQEKDDFFQLPLI